jgi:hypothetical protein
MIDKILNTHLLIAGISSEMKAAFPLVIQSKNKAHSYESRKSNFFKTHYEITKHNNNKTSMYEMEHTTFSL